MFHKIPATRMVSLPVIAAFMMASAAFPQSGSPKAAKAAAEHKTGKAYVPPKTPWGDPDLEGLWPGTYDIPMERDPKYGNRTTLTDEEVKAKQKQIDDRREQDLGGGEVLTGKEVVDVNQPAYWMEYQDANRQTSMVVDPPDGRIPPLTPMAAKLTAESKSGESSGKFNSWTDEPIYQRCITRGLIGSITYIIYNNGNQILQEPGYVIIRNEMIHEARVIPLDGRPHIGADIKTYMGDSRGHWEGNTLVVETTNFNGRTPIGANLFTGPPAGGPKLRIVERFTRTGPDQLDYDATIDDPEWWTRSWTIHYPYKRDPNYTIEEYACHEANYGLLNILAGARAEEKEAAEKSGTASGEADNPKK